MKRVKIYKFFIFLLIFAFFMVSKNVKCNLAYGFEDSDITAKSALLVDYETGTILYEKNSNERLPIASMTKIASLAVVFDYMNKGIIKENDFVSVSESAASVGGSSAFLDAGSKYKVGDLIKSVIIASANDSTVALAEFVAGSEDIFVSKMNKLASNYDLKDTHFVNSTGLPVEGHYSSANDLVKIYKLICENPIYKKYSKIWMTDFIHPTGRKTGLVNTNRLVKTFDGIDGGKTGYTDKAKFCLIASATRGNTRLMGVVIGAENSKTRFSEMSKLFNFGFANFESKQIIDINVPVSIHKFKNAKNMVTVYPERNLIKFLPKTEEFIYSTDYEIFELKAPVKKGDEVGKIFVFDENNMVIDEIPLVAGNDSLEVGFYESFDKILQNW